MRLEAWKGILETKGLRVNVKKTRVMITSKNTEKLTEEGKFPLAVWRKSVGSNSILCQFCRCQVKDVKVLGKLSKKQV